MKVKPLKGNTSAISRTSEMSHKCLKMNGHSQDKSQSHINSINLTGGSGMGHGGGSRGADMKLLLRGYCRVIEAHCAHSSAPQ